MKKNYFYLFLLVLIAISFFALQSCQTTNVSDVQNEKKWKAERTKELEQKDAYLQKLEKQYKYLSELSVRLFLSDLGTSLGNASDTINKTNNFDDNYYGLERFEINRKKKELKEKIDKRKKEIKDKINKEYQTILESEGNV